MTKKRALRVLKEETMGCIYKLRLVKGLETGNIYEITGLSKTSSVSEIILIGVLKEFNKNSLRFEILAMESSSSHHGGKGPFYSSVNMLSIKSHRLLKKEDLLLYTNLGYTSESFRNHLKQGEL